MLIVFQLHHTHPSSGSEVPRRGTMNYVVDCCLRHGTLSALLFHNRSKRSTEIQFHSTGSPPESRCDASAGNQAGGADCLGEARLLPDPAGGLIAKHGCAGTANRQSGYFDHRALNEYHLCRLVPAAFLGAGRLFFFKTIRSLSNAAMWSRRATDSAGLFKLR